MTINQLKTQAKRLEMMVRRDGHGGFMLTDFNNALIAGPMDIEDLEQLLLEAEKREED